MRSATLDDVSGLAALQTRTDRKYVLAPAVFESLVGALGEGMAVLEIDGVRDFRYQSVYFDTPSLDSYRGAAHGRRRRFKVRIRSYLDAGTCVLEVKTRGGRGETVKHRLPYSPAHGDRLTAEGLAFVAEHAGLEGADLLSPVLTTAYRRRTLVDLAAGTRLTCDRGLVCTSVDGRSVSLPGHLLVETKSTGPATGADRFLWRAGCRPEPVSKFCVGLAALHPDLPANHWHRTLRRYFDR